MRPIAQGLFTEESPPRPIGGRDRASGRLWSGTVQRHRPKSPPGVSAVTILKR